LEHYNKTDNKYPIETKQIKSIENDSSLEDIKYFICNLIPTLRLKIIESGHNINKEIEELIVSDSWDKTKSNNKQVNVDVGRYLYQDTFREDKQYYVDEIIGGLDNCSFQDIVITLTAHEYADSMTQIIYKDIKYKLHGKEFQYVYRILRTYTNTLLSSSCVSVNDINKKSIFVQFEELKKDIFKFPYISEQTSDMKLFAVKRRGWTLKYIKNPTKEMELIAVKNWGSAIQFVKKATEEMKLLAVKNNGFAIQYIKNPTDDMKLLAIENDAMSIEVIKNPTMEMKLLAIKSEGSAIDYIENPTEEMIQLAFKNYGSAIQYIENPTEEMKLLAIEKDGMSIEFIKNPTEK